MFYPDIWPPLLELYYSLLLEQYNWLLLLKVYCRGRNERKNRRKKKILKLWWPYIGCRVQCMSPAESASHIHAGITFFYESIKTQVADPLQIFSPPPCQKSHKNYIHEQPLNGLLLWYSKENYSNQSKSLLDHPMHTI